MRQILLLTLTALLLPWKALATSINLPPWEQLATTSEFIGTVECITAGGIVARYRVIDSWKGAAVGTEMNISQHADVCGPQFPISLVGERFLVFGEKTGSYRISSFTSDEVVPLWWRELPTDFRCFELMPLKEPFGSYLWSFFHTRARQLEDFKTAVTGFLGCGKEEQERRLMLAAVRERLQLPDPAEPSSKGNEADIKLYDALQSTKSVEELWKRIIGSASVLVAPEIPQTADENRAQSLKFSYLWMLMSGGREQCRDLLEKADFSKLPWEKKSLDEALSRILGNLAEDMAQPNRLKSLLKKAPIPVYN